MTILYLITLRDAGYDERLLADVTIEALLLLHRTEQSGDQSHFSSTHVDFKRLLY